MRILIKGGVWKNTEDEILKAAVMKYGLNQWSRISSLLVRKSAKQCKARWYEWLDPAIKKTEWTKEEDEKLLHLAKLMPTQWRTIAPIVGRTPTQCLERYEKLLDMVANKDADYDPTDDPRRLRPGEIDPNPESKPARPDPIDMDEDEKEMLSEARARLANTKGKKAKRKAREKQLEEARRLAQLQKKRELKAAGIELRQRFQRKKGINYNEEVPFELRPTQGFYDTAQDEAKSKEISKEFRPITLEELEGKRRKDIEAALRKQDVARDKLMERHDQPGLLAKQAEALDTNLMRRKGKMMLPAPQVSEAELEAIARTGGAVAMDEDMAEGAGGDATRTLLGDYQQRARLPTDLRTPRNLAAAGQDSIMAQAENLARLTSAQTPLVGGDNPLLHPTDFSGINPKAAPIQTPNPLAAMVTPGGSVPGATPSVHLTVGRRAIAGISATPRGGETPSGSIGATPLRTPLRDELGLNSSEALMAADSQRAERARQVMMRNELQMGLAQLPKPSMEYQIEVPELPEDQEAAEGMEEDAADRDARLRALEAARLEAEMKKRSQAVQRNLPRPLSLELLPQPKPAEEAAQLGLAQQAEQLILQEMTALLQHDSAKYPLRTEKGKKKRAREADAPVPHIEDFDLQLLQQAKLLLAEETSAVRHAMGHDDMSLEEYDSVWHSVVREIIYAPSQKVYVRAASVSNSERVGSVQAQFERVRKEMEKEADRAKKLEDKMTKYCMGLWNRGTKLRATVEKLYTDLQAAERDHRCFQELQAQETRTMPERMAAMRGALKAAQEQEKQLQERYKELSSTKADLIKAA